MPPMRRFIASNPGLESRFRTTIDFEDYSTEECMQILEGFCERKQFKLIDDARETARLIIEHEITTNPNFSNGRFVRNLFEAALSNQSTRLAFSEDFTDEDMVTLTGNDFIGY